jgi:hypothetical protein
MKPKLILITILLAIQAKAQNPPPIDVNSNNIYMQVQQFCGTTLEGTVSFPLQTVYWSNSPAGVYFSVGQTNYCQGETFCWDYYVARLLGTNELLGQSNHVCTGTNNIYLVTVPTANGHAVYERMQIYAPTNVDSTATLQYNTHDLTESSFPTHWTDWANYSGHYAYSLVYPGQAFGLAPYWRAKGTTTNDARIKYDTIPQ